MDEYVFAALGNGQEAVWALFWAALWKINISGIETKKSIKCHSENVNAVNHMRHPSTESKIILKWTLLRWKIIVNVIIKFRVSLYRPTSVLFGSHMNTKKPN